MIQIVLVLLGMLLPLEMAALRAQERSIEVRRFDADIELREDGTAEIRETIRIDFRGSWNGLIRTIPIQYRDARGLAYRLGFELLGVTDGSGEALRVERHWSRGELELQIYLPGASDATREIVIHYLVRHAIRFDEELDEFYWNVTGNDWDMPIGEAHARVRLPAGTAGLQALSYVGRIGSSERGSDPVPLPGAEGFSFSSPRPLDFREGLTIAIGWTPGAIRRPSLLQRVRFFLESNWPLALPLLSLLLMARLWWTRGRDPARGSVPPEYRPPAGLTPAEAGTLLDHSPDPADLSGTIVHLAIRGYLRIEEAPRPRAFGLLGEEMDYRLVRLMGPEAWSDLKIHERSVMKGLFADAPSGERLLSQLEQRFYERLDQIRSEIYRSLVERGAYHRRPDRVVQSYIGIGIGVLLAGLMVAVLLVEEGFPSPLVAFGSALLTALPVVLFGLVMPARSEQGVRELTHLLGLQEFLRRVESDRFRRMITSPAQFEELLPYAMVLGVDPRWSEAFEGILVEPPRWYVGAHPGTPFRPRLLASSMQGFSTRSGSALTSAPRSTPGGSAFGGGGGGGFSGGGFGGGGGRGF